MAFKQHSTGVTHESTPAGLSVSAQSVHPASGEREQIYSLYSLDWLCLEAARSWRAAAQQLSAPAQRLWPATDQQR